MPEMQVEIKKMLKTQIAKGELKDDVCRRDEEIRGKNAPGR